MATFDISQYFTATLPPILAALTKPVRPGAKFKLTVTGPSGGVWYVDTTGTVPAVSTVALDSIDCAMTIADSDFMAIMADPTSSPRKQFTKAFMTGKLTSTGDDKFLALRFGLLLRLS